MNKNLIANLIIAIPSALLWMWFGWKAGVTLFALCYMLGLVFIFDEMRKKKRRDT
jgi:hypothetical protein